MGKARWRGERREERGDVGWGERERERPRETEDKRTYLKEKEEMNGTSSHISRKRK